MATSNAQRFLAAGGDDQALALKMFSGSVIEAFRAKTLLWNSVGPEGVGESSPNVIASKTVDAGNSWQWPIIGNDLTPEYHTPGVELLGQDVALDEAVITIDDILVAHLDVAWDQEQLSHFDVIAPFARKLGRSLAEDFDSKLFVVGVLAAQSAAVTGIHNGGNVVQRVAASIAVAYPNDATGAGNFIADAGSLAQLLDADDVPEDGRYLFITSYIRQILLNNTNIFSSDFTRRIEPNSLNPRAIGELAGFQVLITNHMPSTAITTGPAKYQIDATAAGAGEGAPVALALCGAQEGSAAIGYVAGTGKTGAIYSHMGFDERRNTTFLKSQMMVGAGIVAPWCAGEIHVDTA